jgi:CheY-like chemotaxis protein
MTKKHILIVDDEESVLLVLRNSLNKLGDLYQVFTATNGFDALDMVKERPFDLIITDYRMENLDGLQFIELIQNYQPHTRVILITAYGNAELREEAERLDTYRFLTKPIEIGTFRQIVQEALDLSKDVAISRPGILVLSDERYREVMNSLQQLQTDVGGRCIILSDANGQVIARSGDIAKLPVEQIASLLCGGMATLEAAGQELDARRDAINLSYREGDNLHLYGINIGQQLLLTLIIDNSPSGSRLGTVWYYAQQTAVSLRKLLGESDYTTITDLLDDDANEAFDSELDKLFSSEEEFF